MKKILAMLLALTMVFSLCACGSSNVEPSGSPAPSQPVESQPEESQPVESQPVESEPVESQPVEPEATVMSYAEYAAAALDTAVVVEGYVQAKQSWWDNKATIYTQDKDGAYFLYNMPMTEEEYNQLTIGTKIRVTGYKAAWAGEVEIVDATFEILEGRYVAPALDATALLGTDELINYQNRFVSFSGMTVEPSIAPDGSEVPFLYSWDGSGSEGSDSDLYFNVSSNGQTYNFVVEYYLCDEAGNYGDWTEVYKAVQNLKIGDKIDLEGFLYWYEGANPHITSVVPAEQTKSEGVMTYAEYAAAELDTAVVVETYVQAKQSWWNDQATIYTQDKDGAYFLYNMPMTEEEYNQLTIGTKIRVTGYKAAWAGEVEIVDATFEILEGRYVAPALDATALLGTDELINYQNRFVSFSGMTVEPSIAPDGSEVPFLYSWDGSGSEGSDSDLYFNVSSNGQTYNFVVEYYLCDNAGHYGDWTNVYNAVHNLKIGDKIDLEGFLYWYEGVNPHITSVTPAN